MNKQICDEVKKLLEKIEINGFIPNLQKDQQQIAWNLLELLEKQIDQWSEPV